MFGKSFFPTPHRVINQKSTSSNITSILKNSMVVVGLMKKPIIKKDSTKTHRGDGDDDDEVDKSVDKSF
jgi:hypothetical protein